MRSSPVATLVLILVGAFLLRLAAGGMWQARLDDRFGFGDSESYWVLARSIANGQPYQYGPDDASVFRTPGYPLVLSSLFLVTDEDPPVFWARVLSAICGTAAVACVWYLGCQLFDTRAGLTAAAIASIYPGAIATSVLVLSEAPFCPLLLVHLILWIAASKQQSAKCRGLLAVAAGLAAGAATLVRPSWLLFLPFAMTAALIFASQKRREMVIGLAMAAGVIAVMLPWWIRNAQVVGRFVPTTLQVGASLYDGLHANAAGSSDMSFVADFVEAEKRDPAGAGGTPEDTFEYRLDQRMRSASLAWARAHPGQAIQLALVKFGRMWNLWPNEASFSRWPLRLGVLVTYVPVIVLAFAGAWRTTRLGWPYVLCWLPAVYFTLLHMVFVGSLRYRQPAMLGLIVLAAGYLVQRTRGLRLSTQLEV